MGLSSVTLCIQNGVAFITADQPVSPAQQAQVNAWHLAGCVYAVPEAVTRRQLKEELIACDLIDQVEAALAAIPDTKARRIAQNWWTESQDFRRDHPLIAQIGQALGLTAEQIDAHWIAAAAR